MTLDTSFTAKAAKSLLAKNDISICLPTTPNVDAIASACALYIALTSLGKNVSLACAGKLPADSNIIGQDKIQPSLLSTGNNLVVSFPYQEGAVDKVTYNINNGKFNLVIQPRDGFEKLNPQKVGYSYSGGKAEVIITIYTPALTALGELYESNKNSFNGVELINIDRHFTNANFGSINIVDKKSASISEMVLALIKELTPAVDKDVATNLYAGVASATNNFSAHTVTAETFEVSAFLLKSGAVKRPPVAIRSPYGADPYGSPYRVNDPYGAGLDTGMPAPLGGNFGGGFDDDYYEDDFLDPLPPLQNQPGMPLDNPFAEQPLPSQIPAQPIQNQPYQQEMSAQPQTVQQEAQPVQAAPASQPASSRQVEMGSSSGTDAPPAQIENKETTDDTDESQDWLKPKIFKNNDLL